MRNHNSFPPHQWVVALTPPSKDDCYCGESVNGKSGKTKTKEFGLALYASGKSGKTKGRVLGELGAVDSKDGCICGKEAMLSFIYFLGTSLIAQNELWKLAGGGGSSSSSVWGQPKTEGEPFPCVCCSTIIFVQSFIQRSFRRWRQWLVGTRMGMVLVP